MADFDGYKSSLAAFAGELPVGAVAGRLNESLRRVPRAIVTAEPGAGKSTLLPLTVLQDIPAPGKILMLEPRRLAARQIAVRMAEMIGERPGQTVGYRVRFEQAVSAETRIEVITEGILERRLVEDPFLDGVAAVIFDEFHERSLTCDLCLALTRVVQRDVRPDLRIVLMSATIDAAGIAAALDCPVIECGGRLHPVQIVHCEETDVRNCAADMASAIRRAHREQEGDILAFLPGQAEIVRCAEILGDALGPGTSVCPLYGQLDNRAQRQAIMPSPPGRRKVVLSTNIAETSLTIRGVRAVVDAGFHRALRYEPSSGLSRLETTRISIDMARQRSGRAGRVAAGVCYRLWSKATELRMADTRQPEIMEADLSAMLLAVADCNVCPVRQLPWLTPPPEGHIAEGMRLLVSLGAIDADSGSITPLGHELAALPCHPRVGAMLVTARTPALKALAADIAALLEERDPVNDENDADINTRLCLLRGHRRNRRNPGRWERIMRVAAQYRALAHVPEDNGTPDPEGTGSLIAAAYPERIAQKTDDGRWRLASGAYATLADADNLNGSDMLAVATLDRRIFLASPVTPAGVEAHASWRDNVSWDSRRGRAVACRELRVGVLVLDRRPIDGDGVRGRITEAVAAAAAKEGHSMFGFDDNVRRLQQRLETLSQWHPELNLPAVDDDALLASVSDWLPMYIGRATSVQELRKIDLCAVITGMLDYAQQAAADSIVPTHITLPCGRRVRVDYRAGAELPVVSARIQDCFGLTDTPRLDNGQRPVLMELLSPGFKPVQLTADLHNFWATTYFEVRKELRRRYPRHRWPDNPADPQPPPVKK